MAFRLKGEAPGCQEFALLLRRLEFQKDLRVLIVAEADNGHFLSFVDAADADEIAILRPLLLSEVQHLALVRENAAGLHVEIRLEVRRLLGFVGEHLVGGVDSEVIHLARQMHLRRHDARLCGL